MLLSRLTDAAMRLATRFKKGGVIINEHTLTLEQLALHVETLGRWFDFIHPDELEGRVARPRARPFCLLTFDDGHRSNATICGPELERRGIPACFLIVTSFVGSEGVLWFTLYSRLREKLGGRLPPGLAARAVKQLPQHVLVERVERACREHGVEPDLSDDHCVPMTWDEARDLRRRGFDVGAHGHSHAILTRLTREEALDEISHSIARVSAELGEPCRSFAFPNGNYTAELAQHAARCGARLVMTAEPTWMDSKFPLWRLPRVQLFGDHDQARMELKLATSATGRFVPSGDGTRQVYCWVNKLAERARGAALAGGIMRA